MRILRKRCKKEQRDDMERYDFAAQPSILIQGAMDVETRYLIDRLQSPEEIALGGWTFHTGFLGKYKEPVIVSRTYQGMVNAAAASSLALARFSPKAVVNQGISGGHAPSLHKGDIVLGEKVIPMGAMLWEYAAEGAGMRPDRFELLPIEIYDRKTGTVKKVKEFPCDKELLARAQQVETPLSVRRGILGSADEWNNQIDRIAMLRERYHTASEDMESAAAAQVCLSYGIPFIGIRILSNSIVTGEDYDESVALDGQKFILRFVEALHEESGASL